ncbi:hypothetical protein [Rhodococcus sp. WAY2]|uniref:hypothetical protein n=1 Tax=Rhodococcus sp. WAY2 TaxID=2663121 RepID=UPI00131F5F4D|nr:hypothetical protein [Rhodococcus sp. WAY2]QHE72917.1 hypothetical protein GFS60_06566 [Rhodococcus sp. WAY2]
MAIVRPDYGGVAQVVPAERTHLPVAAIARTPLGHSAMAAVAAEPGGAGEGHLLPAAPAAVAVAEPMSRLRTQ